MRLDVIRRNYGHEPLDTSQFGAQPPAVGANATPGPLSRMPLRGGASAPAAPTVSNW